MRKSILTRMIDYRNKWGRRDILTEEFRIYMDTLSSRWSCSLPSPTPVGWAKFSDLFPRIEFGEGKTNFTAAQSGKYHQVISYHHQ